MIENKDHLNKEDSKEEKKLNQQARIKKARARRLIMQGLYQHLLCDHDIDIIIKQSLENKDIDFDTDFLISTFKGIDLFRENLEKQFTPLLNRELNTLDYIEHAILLLGSYELSEKEVPIPVIINEYVTLAKKFGGTDSYKFINGVLDKLAKSQN